MAEALGPFDTVQIADGNFLFYALMREKERLAGVRYGSHFGSINKNVLYDFELDIPSLPEQEAIAGVLSKLQGAVEAQDKIIATLKELKAATLAKLFREGLRGEPLKETEIGEIPESWEMLRLDDVCRTRWKWRYPDREAPSTGETEPFHAITAQRFRCPHIKPADEFVTEQAFKKCHLPLVSSGSIVVAITGQGKTLGHAAMVELETCIESASGLSDRQGWGDVE